MPQTDLNTPGARLRAARKAAGLTAAQLGMQVAALAGRKKGVSESAIRNQENGTNGIPMALLSAYSEILKVSPNYLLLGDPPESDVVIPPEIAERVRYASDRFFVALQGMASERWIETTSSGSNDFLGLHLEVEEFDAEELSALEVSDASLEPFFPKGSYLITAHASICPIYDGAIVILFSASDGIMLECVRRVKVSDDGELQFVPVSGRTSQILSANSPRSFIVDSVVVAAVTLFEPTKRRALPLPEELRPPPFKGPDSDT